MLTFLFTIGLWIVVVQSLSCVRLFAPHGLQHARLTCPSRSPGVCSDTCPLGQGCHPTISSSATPSPLAFSVSQHQGLFQWAGSLHQVAKYWSFSSASVLPMKIHDWFSLGLNGLISFLSKDSQKSSPAPQCESISSSALSLLYCPALTSVHDLLEKKHSCDCTNLCQQSDVSAF